MKRIVSLNLALLLLFTLVCISTPTALAADAPQLVVNGLSYDYTKNQSGDGWTYQYYKDENSQHANLTLNQYNGGTISVPCDLDLYCAETNVVTATNSAGLVVEGNFYTSSQKGTDSLSVTGASCYAAIYATNTIVIRSSIEAHGGGVSAFSANKLTFLNSFYDTFVGSSSADSIKGTYTDQNYFKRSKTLLSLILVGEPI